MFNNHFLLKTTTMSSKAYNLSAVRNQEPVNFETDTKTPKNNSGDKQSRIR